MSIKITRPGISTTLQDIGRSGYRNIGIGTAGAMDGFACRIANYLCGNSDGDTVIEMNFPAPEILFNNDALIAITGADFSPRINEENAGVWKTLFVKKGDVLTFVKPLSGSRAYLAVTGGWAAQQWLGSCSTHLKLRTGGHFGRVLQAKDELIFLPSKYPLATRKVFPWSVSRTELDKIYSPANAIRCIAAPEYDQLTDESKRSLEQQQFTISRQSDRMGFHLIAEPLSRSDVIELVSSPVDCGTLQLLPGGNCIVLMADHQTTGGYPRIASVIKADLPKLAQARPGDPLNFRIVSIGEAENKYIQMLESLGQIKKACAHQLHNFVSA